MSCFSFWESRLCNILGLHQPLQPPTPSLNPQPLAPLPSTVPLDPTDPLPPTVPTVPTVPMDPLPPTVPLPPRVPTVPMPRLIRQWCTINHVDSHIRGICTIHEEPCDHYFGTCGYLCFEEELKSKVHDELLIKVPKTE